MEYSPFACMQQISFCCLSDSLGCLLLALARKRAYLL